MWVSPKARAASTTACGSAISINGAGIHIPFPVIGAQIGRPSTVTVDGRGVVRSTAPLQTQPDSLPTEALYQAAALLSVPQPWTATTVPGASRSTRSAFASGLARRLTQSLVTPRAVSPRAPLGVTAGGTEADAPGLGAAGVGGGGSPVTV